MVDAGILEDVLWHIHNWFVRGETSGRAIQVAEGALPASVTSSLVDGQWYRITGSLLNDGLHQHPATDLEDETFDGTISSLAIPKPLLRVVEEIQDWIDRNAEAIQKAQSSPYQSESFGGYSYSIRGDLTSDSASGGLTGWQAAFASRLNPWRKIA